MNQDPPLRVHRRLLSVVVRPVKKLAAPDPSRAKETISVRWLPTQASDKCARIHRRGSSHKTASRTSLQRNAEKGRGLSADPWNRFALGNFHEALRLIRKTSGDGSAICASSKLGWCRFGHFTPLRSTSAYYARNSGLSMLFIDFFAPPGESVRPLGGSRWSARSEATRTTHGAVVAGLPAGID